ncbi:MAG: hypothetical protein ABWU84_12700 [Pyrobaculum sp.]|uniref:hypothetical protein n=1 Tax=Pyrobaculum sp. TaxID=2004705 RepID=UPI003EE98AC8
MEAPFFLALVLLAIFAALTLYWLVVAVDALSKPYETPRRAAAVMPRPAATGQLRRAGSRGRREMLGGWGGGRGGWGLPAWELPAPASVAAVLCS